MDEGDNRRRRASDAQKIHEAQRGDPGSACRGKDHTLTEMWRVEWDNRYEINRNGKFIFKGQQETYRTDGVDDPVIEQFKSRNLPQ